MTKAISAYMYLKKITISSVSMRSEYFQIFLAQTIYQMTLTLIRYKFRNPCDNGDMISYQGFRQTTTSIPSPLLTIHTYKYLRDSRNSHSACVYQGQGYLGHWVKVKRCPTLMSSEIAWTKEYGYWRWTMYFVGIKSYRKSKFMVRCTDRQTDLKQYSLNH